MQVYVKYKKTRKHVKSPKVHTEYAITDTKYPNARNYTLRARENMLRARKFTLRAREHTMKARKYRLRAREHTLCTRILQLYSL